MTTPTGQELEVVQPSALESISRAEVDIAISTARRYPRSIHAVKLAMMGFATLDEETAAACFYTLPRGGKNIQGPSVRLAEIALSCYGNIKAGSRIIQTDTTGSSPHVVVQAVCMDLEKNVSVTIEKRRRIVGKKSKGGAIDEDDINLAANAGSAIAFRDACFKIIPLALIKPVFEAARKVAIGDARTLNDRRARCIETFGKMGVSKEKVLAKLEKKAVEEVGLEDLETLIGLHNAIKEGEINIDDAFKPAVKPADLSDLGPAKAPIAVSTPLKEGDVWTDHATGVVHVFKAGAWTPSGSPVATPVTISSAPLAKDAPTPATATGPGQTEANPASLNPVPQEVLNAPACKYCHQPVVEMATHECPEMRQALAAADGKEPSPMEALSALMERDNVSLDQVMAFTLQNKLRKPAQKLSDLSTSKLAGLAASWDAIKPEIQKLEAK